MRVMSFNIRFSNVGKRKRKDRVDDVCQTITDSNSDLVGVQEATTRWMRDLEKKLNDYSHFGVGRDNGKKRGEHSAVFYKKDKFEVVESGNFWYSDTPAVPSRCWSSVHNRICSYAVLREKASGKMLAHLNTHFDCDIDLAARSVPILLKKVDELNKYPLVLTGDFNSPEGSKPYNEIAAVLTDSKFSAPDTMNSTTFHDEHPENHENDIIDFVFINDKFSAKKYRVIDKKINGNYASDHFAIYADLDF